eukprot:m.233677 g.233677  ORF g.233677 m.233677 type:complete len:123 (-) comp33645_c3_seq2:292-660(-)
MLKQYKMSGATLLPTTRSTVSFREPSKLKMCSSTGSDSSITSGSGSRSGSSFLLNLPHMARDGDFNDATPTMPLSYTVSPTRSPTNSIKFMSDDNFPCGPVINKAIGRRLVMELSVVIEEEE